MPRQIGLARQPIGASYHVFRESRVPRHLWRLVEREAISESKSYAMVVADALRGYYGQPKVKEMLKQVQHPLRQHRLDVRRNCTVKLDLPKDLTQKDADKIVDYVQSLVVQ